MMMMNFWRRSGFRSTSYPYRMESSTQLIRGEHHGSKLHGSLLWSYERLISIALLPSLGYAMLMDPHSTSHSINDGILNVLIPLHSYLGVHCILTDYLPKRKVPKLYQLGLWSLRFVTLAVAYGGWKLNTQDIGIGATMRGLWNAQSKTKKSEEGKQ